MRFGDEKIYTAVGCVWNGHFAGVIVLVLDDISGRLMYDFLKSADQNTKGQSLYKDRYSICRPNEHHLYGGFSTLRTTSTIGSVWILYGLVLY